MSKFNMLNSLKPININMRETSETKHFLKRRKHVIEENKIKTGDGKSDVKLNDNPEKYSQLLSGFERQSSSDDFTNPNIREHSNLGDTKQDSFYYLNVNENKKNYPFQNNTNIEENNFNPYHKDNHQITPAPNIVESYNDTNSNFKEINTNQMKFIFKEAKRKLQHEEKSDDKQFSTSTELDKKINLVMNDNEIKNMTNNLTQTFTKMSKIFEDPNALKPLEDPFGVKRGICENCLEDCKGYSQSSNHINNFPSICQSCNCGASSHKQIAFNDVSLNSLLTSIKHDILPYVNYINDDDIEFNSFLAVFSLEDPNYSREHVNTYLNILQEAGFKVILSDIKILANADGNDDAMINRNINDYFSSKKGVKDYHNQFYQNENRKTEVNTRSVVENNLKEIDDNIDHNELMERALKKDFRRIFLTNLNNPDIKFNENRQTFKETTFENLIRKKINSKTNVTDNKNSCRNNLNSDYFSKIISGDSLKNKDKKEFYHTQNLYSVTNTNLNYMNSNNSQLTGLNLNLKNCGKELLKNPLLCLCISASGKIKMNNPYNEAYNQTNPGGKKKSQFCLITSYFEKFHLNLRNNQSFNTLSINSYNLLYYSKSKINAIWDVQTVFPDLFRINSVITIISEKQNLFRLDKLGNQLKNFLWDDEREESPNEVKYENNLSNLNNISQSVLNSFSQSQNKLNQKSLSKPVYETDTNTTNKVLFMKYLSQFKDFLTLNSISCAKSNHFQNFESIVNYCKDNMVFKLDNDAEIIYLNNFLNFLSDNLSKNSHIPQYDDHNKKISISLCLLKRVGALNNYNPLGFIDNLDLVNIKSQREQEILSSVFFNNETTKYSRILLIFRPLAVRSGLSDCILNIFKINSCLILKRKSLILSRSQIEFLYNLEFFMRNCENDGEINDSRNLISFDDYHKLMTDFNVEVVVLAKFGVLEDTKLLCGNLSEIINNYSAINNINVNSNKSIDDDIITNNSNNEFKYKNSPNNPNSTENSFINSNINVDLQNSMGSVLPYLNNLNLDLEVEDNVILTDDKINSKKFKEKLNIQNNHRNRINVRSFNYSQNSYSSHNCFNSTASLLNLQNIFDTIIRNKLKTNNQSLLSNYDNLNSIKKNLIKFCSQFNLFTYNTNLLGNLSDNSSLEINYFFPEFGNMHELILLIKPNKIGEINHIIKQTLLRMDFEIQDTIGYQINEDEFGNLFDKYLTMNVISPFDYSSAKEIFTTQGNVTEIVRIVKPGGRFDLNKIIGKENYQVFKRNSKRDFDVDYINKLTFNEKMKILKENCYLLHLSCDIEYFYPIVNNKVSIIEGQYILKHAVDVEISEDASSNKQGDIWDFKNSNKNLNNLKEQFDSINNTSSRLNDNQVLDKNTKFREVRGNINNLSSSAGSYFQNIRQKLNQSQLIQKSNSTVIMHILNSCLKCTVGDGIRYDLNLNNRNNSTTNKEKLIERYLKFYHYDHKFDGDSNNKIYNEYIVNVLNKYMFSNWNRINKIENSVISLQSEINYLEKYFAFLHFPEDCLNTQISFLVESSEMGFYEIRIPILENDFFDMFEINLAKNYLYSDLDFYEELDEKFRNEIVEADPNGCIVMEWIPFYNNLVEENENFNTLNLVENEKKMNKDSNMKILNIHKSTSEKNLNEEWVKNNILHHYKENTPNKENDLVIKNDSDSDIDDDSNNNTENLLNKLAENIKTISKRIFYKTKFEMSKSFYKTCSFISENKNNFVNKSSQNVLITPRNYHYRIKPDDITSDIRRIYEVEEFAGLYFIEIVAQDYSKYRPQEITNRSLKTDSDFDNLSYIPNHISFSTPKQSSLPTYLWGRKLAEICNLLTIKPELIINSKENTDFQIIPNAGPIIYSVKDQKLKGLINSKYLVQYHQYLYINILEEIKAAQGIENSKCLLDFKIFNEIQLQTVETKLHKILTSNIFKSSRSLENLTLSPVRITENNLRIHKHNIKNTTDPIIVTAKPKIEIDHEIKFREHFKQLEDNNSISHDISSKSIKLIDIFTHKSSKYHIYAAVHYLINVIYKKLNRKSQLLNNDEIEYDRMIDAMLTGFNSNIDYNSPEINDENECLNAYKIEYFLYILTEIKFMLNELKVCKSKMNFLQNNLRELRLVKMKNVNNVTNPNVSMDKENMLNSYITKLKNSINELNINIEIVFSQLVGFNIHHQITEKEDKKIIILPKERYHIPMHFPEYWEKDVENPKYKQIRNVKESYVMDLNKLNYFLKKKEQIVTERSKQEGIDNPFILTQNKLRKFDSEFTNEIIVEKKKDEKRRHPIKLFAELVRKQNK